MENFTQRSKRSAVQFLHDLSAGNGAAVYGQKVGGLIKAIALGMDVLPGIVISAQFAKRIADSSDAGPYIHLLAPFVSELIDKTDSRSFIVRSSSDFEDRKLSSFSGLFDSYMNVVSNEEMIISIIKIVKNSNLHSLRSYFSRFGLDISSTHMGILIQPQIEYDVGGVVSFDGSRFVFEFTTESVSEAISGKESYSVIASLDGEIDPVRILDRDADVEYGHFGFALHQNHEFWEFLKASSRSAEFLISKGKFFVVQLKNLSLQDKKSIGNNSPHPIETSNKTEAMQFFINNELFSNDCAILESGWRMDEVESSATEMFKSNEIVTIRLSRGAEIGLPRSFCVNPREVLRFVQAYAAKSHDIIIHGYIDVARSLEVLALEDGFLLEHVPGMWESPNRLQPDVVLMASGNETQYRFTRSRDPVVDPNTRAAKGLGKPLSKMDMVRLREIGAKVWRTMKSEYRSNLPLNVHLVTNSDMSEVHALNIRPGFNIEGEVLNRDDVRLVRNIGDLSGWSSEQVVRLALATKRGDEKSLIPIAEKLSKADYPIIVDFGLLSHPAMILRDYGCRLLPSYLVPGCLDSQDYDIEKFEHDFADEPVTRILGEAVVYDHDQYHIVLDRDPVAEDHFLCMNRNESLSVFDSRSSTLVQELLVKLSDGRSALFFERGRAEVCTSLFTWPREHFHVLLGIDIERVVEMIWNMVGGDRYDRLTEAYAHAAAYGPYSVYGSFETGFFVTSNRSIPKRLLRSACDWAEKYGGDTR